MEEDLEAEWKEYSKNACFIGNPEMSKLLWMTREKHKRGIPVEPLGQCYECKGNVYHGTLSFHAIAKKHVAICETCRPAFDKD